MVGLSANLTAHSARTKFTRAPRLSSMTPEESLHYTDVTAETKPADASVAKEFFISVITRDIGLERAILDLVDNSVDGARRMRGTDPPSGDKWHPSQRYEGLRIDLVISKDQFLISDNCGGIPLKVAQQYAFRFGRSQDAPIEVRTPHAIGLFGIGMKRALFKLGKHFQVESTSDRTRFVIDQNVAQWQGRDKWDFPFDMVQRFDSDVPEASRGTTITVTDLHPTVREDFDRENWRNELINELRDALREPIAQGLKATVNKVEIKAERPALYESDRIRPYITQFSPESDPQVTVRLYVGVAEGNLDRAGWYVFCNDRLVIPGDQTSLTGWGEKEPARIPKFHNQYHRFWGYAYLDSDDPARLPWNTTKTGIDVDSPLWRAVRQQMILAMKPVTDFLNALRKEERGRSKATETQVRRTPLIREWENARESRRELTSLSGNPERFLWPDLLPEEPGPKEVLIKYTRPEVEVERAMSFFRVRSAADVGLQTFLYWQTAES